MTQLKPLLYCCILVCGRHLQAGWRALLLPSSGCSQQQQFYVNGIAAGGEHRPTPLASIHMVYIHQAVADTDAAVLQVTPGRRQSSLTG